MDVPEIFDRRRRRIRRDRAARRFADHDFLRTFMIDGLCERLASVTREFTDVLDLGCFDQAIDVPGAVITRVDAGAAFAQGGVQADEDRLPFAEPSFDLVLSAGVLDTVNDLPGALIQVRRALRPDGLFLAAFVGAGCLPALRAALRSAEPNVIRLHPQIDVRSAGDLLVRADFALPVAVTETLDVRYADMIGLLSDLRGMAATNLMRGAPPLSRGVLNAASDAFSAHADADGRITERFEVIFATGWAPGPGQPAAARRGSATASLADALKAR